MFGLVCCCCKLVWYFGFVILGLVCWFCNLVWYVCFVSLFGNVCLCCVVWYVGGVIWFGSLVCKNGFGNLVLYIVLIMLVLSFVFGNLCLVIWGLGELCS